MMCKTSILSSVKEYETVISKRLYICLCLLNLFPLLSYGDPFAGNILNTRSDSVILKPYYITAGPYENVPNPALVTGDLETQQFSLYDGKMLPEVKNTPHRMYTLRTRFYLIPGYWDEKPFPSIWELFSYPATST